MYRFSKIRSSYRRWGQLMVRPKPIHIALLAAALLANMLTWMTTTVAATETWFDPGSQRMPVGAGAFEVSGVPRGPVTIYTYRPPSASSNSPIWVVMPGTRREAHRHLAFEYYDTWQPLADQYGAILLVPQFTAEKWPGAWAYNMGNVRSRRLEAKPWRQTSFYVVEEAFRMAAASLGSPRRRFSMFGHGAGGQFVQRYVLHSGCRMIDRAVAANPGWYMVPDYDSQFPFGLREAPIEQAALRSAFACKLALLLGKDDVNYARLRNDPDALKQGKTRYDRGIYFFNRSRAIAARLGAHFNWRLQEVPGVGHEASEMSPAAAALMARAAVAASN
jgi:hypothetical protein